MSLKGCEDCMRAAARKVDCRALKFAIAQVDQMHGSVTSDPEYPHIFAAIRCPCEYGVTIRALKALRKELR